MASPTDGGPVFPTERTEQIGVAEDENFSITKPMTVTYPGMSLRDWFAGQFGPSIFSAIYLGEIQRGVDWDIAQVHAAARAPCIAIEVANAMLKAREAADE